MGDPLDRAALADWYRQAMPSRVEELCSLLEPLGRGGDASSREVRDIARSLRGSGGTFGFHEVSDVAGLVERAPPEQLLRCTEGLIVVLRQVAWPDEPARHGTMEWMERALRVPHEEAALPVEPVEAWLWMAGRTGLEPWELAERIARAYGLEAADLAGVTAAATRLVPQGLVRDRGVVPLSEDGVNIFVAVANPTDLRTELELERVTGRRAVFRVAPPDELRLGIDAFRPAVSLEADRHGAGAAAPDKRSRTVLLVDDDAGARLLARAALERRGGFHVLEAEDGRRGLDRLEEEPDVDLVVVDLDMPRVDGRQLVRTLRSREREKQPAVIVVTGAEDALLEADLIEDGADDYIRKPLDPRLFLARVTATLRRTAG